MTRPPTFMVWTLNDEVIESPGVLNRQFDALHEAGFHGVAPYVRCSRYTWYDPPARRAFRTIDRLCRKHGMEFWLGADPRFVSRQLIGDGPGLELILFGNCGRADVVPNFGQISGGVYTVRCDLSPRHVHTLNEVAVEYHPRGIAGVFAVQQQGTAAARAVDITASARFFYNARERYVEVFGRAPKLSGTGWSVLPFFRVVTNHVDFSDRRQMGRYLDMLAQLRKEGLRPQGLMWDEPGYTCTYGTLPFSPPIRRAYTHTTGRTIDRELWKLAVPASDGTHVRVRVAYYEAVQRSLNDANRSAMRHAQKLWGRGCASGVHDTWHFESADMCDMNHGSLDLWKAASAKTGGFVDLGGIDQLRDPDSSWYANLAAMSVICPSLAKRTSERYACNNLWTVGDDNGAGWQSTVMDHCANVMALFGTAWMAHAYGPVGTIGEERSFLGSPPLPGYPDHSTWPHYPVWNKRLQEHLHSVGGRLPESRLLVIFPVETMYAMAGPAADALAREIFGLILALLDAHYLIDVQASSICTEGKWKEGRFCLAGERYAAVLLPGAEVIPADLSGMLRRGGERVVCVDRVPDRTSRGNRLMVKDCRTVSGIAGAMQRLEKIPELRPIQAPEGCWVTLTRTSRGSVVTAVPARHGYQYGGHVELEGTTAEIPRSGGLTRIEFPRAGEPKVTTIQVLAGKS